MTDDRRWRLYVRAIDILDGRSNGHAMPIIRRLAARGFPPAVTMLTDHVSDRRAVALLRRAAFSDDATSAYNLAITFRNRGDLVGYRHALARAARLDAAAADEFKRFRTRFPEPVMRRFGRLCSRRAG